MFSVKPCDRGFLSQPVPPSWLRSGPPERDESLASTVRAGRSRRREHAAGLADTPGRVVRDAPSGGPSDARGDQVERWPGTMAVTSAGLLLFRTSTIGAIEVLIAHPGGPFWARKDLSAWSVPKGEYRPGEDALDAAYREFDEEVGISAPEGRPFFLGERRQPGGKRVSVWALEGDLDVSYSSSNTFVLEWPRGSGRFQEFPEVDRVEWVPIDDARRKLVKGQVPFLQALLEAVGARSGEPGSGFSTPAEG